MQSSCILNPLFQVEASPCTSAWEHLHSVTLSTMSRATINHPPSDISHLVPASKTKWNHTTIYVGAPMNSTYVMNNEEWRRQRI